MNAINLWVTIKFYTVILCINYYEMNAFLHKNYLMGSEYISFIFSVLNFSVFQMLCLL